MYTLLLLSLLTSKDHDGMYCNYVLNWMKLLVKLHAHDACINMHISVTLANWV